MTKKPKLNNTQPINTGGQMINPLQQGLNYIHEHIMFLNSSKFFAGVIMILLNMGGKLISIQFSKSTEEYMKYSLSKQILVFSMAWMATRDIYTALILTAVFTVLSEYLFNEESKLCIVPHNYRILHKLVDINNDGKVSDAEIVKANAILEKYKKEQEVQTQRNALDKFQYYMNDMNTV
jgi:hypothetical protein